MNHCNRCKVLKPSDQFFSLRGKPTKTCKTCRDKATAYKKSSKCEHNRRRNLCKDCGGSSICEHNRIRNQCKDCGGFGVAISIMIKCSRRSDKKNNRYDADHFIDKCFLEGLFEDNPELICTYCNDSMSLDYDDPKKVTIERVDNSIGHIKSNCILACLQCNVRRVGQLS